MKRIIRTASILVGLLVATAGAALYQAGRRGSGAVEQWVTGQIQLVADAYLAPKLTFTDLDYEFPSTVKLKCLRLTADDPAHPGKTIDILGCEEAQLELGEIPQPGHPIRIASIVLVKPLFQAVRAGDGTTRLVGFSELIRPNVEITTQPNDGGAPRLSEFLDMRHVELVDGRIISDPRLPGVPRMEIDRINTRLSVQREGGGWYALNTRITREPIFDLNVTGRLNLDTFTVADATILLKAQVAREYDGYLPPEMQQFLREHEVQGTLEAKITGNLPVLEPARGRVRMEASLANANVSFGDYRLPVDSLALSASLDDGVLRLSKLNVKALRGEADVEGAVVMNDGRDADVRVVVRDMLLDDTIRDGSKAAKEPKYGGRVKAEIVAAAPLRAISTESFTRTWGKGTIEVDQGRLVHIPVINGLGQTITKSASWLTGRGGGKGTGTDRATVVFALREREARCSEMTYVGDVFAARGRGTVGFNRQLDLIVNAGPLEKMQSLLGRHVGGMFGKLTDAVAGYHVTGTVAKPEIELQLIGGRVNRVGRGIKDGVGQIMDEIGDLAGAGG
jgi:hypothetical protein